LHAAEDVPTVGRIAVLSDPQSAAFGIIKPAM
jgi:predicted enzyme related to lactoylglutathione lyase